MNSQEIQAGRPAPDFLIVTERGGEPVTKAQIARLAQRYGWASAFCRDKDVLELACGTGAGLGLLAKTSRSLIASDSSETVLSLARQHYGSRIDLRQFDACKTPLPAASFDVLILFEAIYYLPEVNRFLAEAHRLLRSGGHLLLATANKDLFDFNPSPFSHCYFNPPELTVLLVHAGFSPTFYGGSPVGSAGPATAMLRAIKTLAVKLHLIPRTMKGKRLLKRLVFGPLQEMPRELELAPNAYDPPVPIAPDKPDTRHQVLYCVAVKN